MARPGVADDDDGPSDRDRGCPAICGHAEAAPRAASPGTRNGQPGGGASSLPRVQMPIIVQGGSGKPNRWRSQ